MGSKCSSVSLTRHKPKQPKIKHRPPTERYEKRLFPPGTIRQSFDATSQPLSVRSGCSSRIKMQSERFEEFRLELASNIRKTICDLRDDGILAMSRNNLLQVTPSPKVARGPIGPNARSTYERIFDDVIDQLPRGYRRFVQDDCSIIAAAKKRGAR